MKILSPKPRCFANNVLFSSWFAMPSEALVTRKS